MRIELRNPAAVAEVEEMIKCFQLCADTLVERLIIDAGRWMPMETLADSYWREEQTSAPSIDIVPSWHSLVTSLPVFAKHWDLQIVNHPPKFELRHVSGVQVSLSIYDSASALWTNERGLLLRLAELRQRPTVTIPKDISRTPSQRQSLIAQARKIVAEIDPLSIVMGLERDMLLQHIEANRAEFPCGTSPN